MLPNPKILMSLATVVAVSLSAPPNATNSGPDKGASNNSIEPFPGWVQNAPFLLPKAISDFSLELLTKLLENPYNKDKNIVFSPFIIHMAISMVLCASSENSQTRQQIAQALAIDDTLINTYLSNYLQIMKDYADMKSDGVQIELATGIFLSDDFTVKKGYQDLLEGAYLTSVDNFGNDPSKAIKKINDFVERKTYGMIKQLLEGGSMNANTLMVLVSALFFNGEFLNKFDRSQTKPMQFTRLDGQVITIDEGMTMICHDNEILIAEYLEISSTVLELTFKKRNIKLFIIVPFTRDYDSLEYAAKNFNFEVVRRYYQVYDEGLKITMAAFEASFSMELANELIALGMTDIFSADADLQKMTDMDVEVSEVISKSVVKVNEEGAKASAAAGIAIKTRVTPKDPEEFSVDGPFVFKIMDTKRKITLFEGIILDPSKKHKPV